MSRKMASAWVHRSMARSYSPRLVWQSPRLPSAVPSPWRSPVSRKMASAWVHRSMARSYSPRLPWQFPRLPSQAPSPWRSPMSRAIASAWVYRSMARSYSPRLPWQFPRLPSADALALAVADVAGDSQRLGVQVDGPLVLAQAGGSSSPGCPAWTPSPWRSPVSRAMASAWVCRSMARSVLAQAEAAEPQAAEVGGVQGGVGDPPVDAPVQLGQGAVVAPHQQVVEVDVVEHGGRGVVVAGVAAQLELGQLRADVLQGAPGLPRRADLGVVVRGAGLQARQRERGRGITGTPAGRWLSA